MSAPTTAWALFQLASPALPIGGYSYSGGLEWAIESGQVHDEASAYAWISDVLTLPLACFEGPLVYAAWAQGHDEQLGAPPPRSDEHGQSLQQINALAWAARETAELRLESEQMGFSLQRWLQAVCPDPEWDAHIDRVLRPLSLPVAWALAARRLGLSALDAVRAYLWSYTENQVMVLLKAMPMGQMAGQRLLRSLTPVLEAALTTAVARVPAEWSSAAPLLAVASCCHETQYSRLFRS